MSWLLRTRSSISGLKWSPEFRGNMIGFWTMHLQRNLVMQLFLFDSCYFLRYLEIIWNHFDQTMWMSPFADTRPLRDLNNARVLSYSSLEEASGRSSRRKRKPTCYKEPPINRLGFKLFLPLFSCSNPCSAVIYSLSRAGLSVSLFKVLLTLCVLWPSSSTTVWLCQNSASARMDV